MRVKVKHAPALFSTARIQKFKLDIAFSPSMSPEKAENWVLQGVRQECKKRTLASNGLTLKTTFKKRYLKDSK